jgi:hypothetical protein
VAWKFTVFDETFREAELTLGQAERVEDLLGKNWSEVHPLRSAKAARRLAAVMYADRTGISVEDSLTKLGEVRQVQFLEEVDLNDSDDLPTVMEEGNPHSAGEDSTGS